MTRSTLTGTKPDGTQTDATFDASGNLKVGSATTPTTGALTDVSGTIASGGAAQVASTAKGRVYLYLENPKTETERLWFSTVTTAVAASPSIPLDPGEWFCFEGSFIPNTAVSIVAATTGHKWIGREA